MHKNDKIKTGKYCYFFVLSQYLAFKDCMNNLERLRFVHELKYGHKKYMSTSNMSIGPV